MTDRRQSDSIDSDPSISGLHGESETGSAGGSDGLVARLRRRRWVLAGVGVGIVVAAVALVVFLSAFVFGIDAHHGHSPTASFDFAYHPTNDSARFLHAGGNTFSAENSDGLAIHVTSEGESWSNDPEVTFSLPVDAGDSILVDGVPPGATVQVIWTASGGGKTQPLATFEVPEETGGIRQWWSP